MAGRNGSLRDTTITLTVKFLDAAGNLADPDNSPMVDIFPAGKDPNSGTTVDGDAIILDASQTSYGNPPGANYIVRNSVGCYSYNFPIPNNGDLGVWFDRWTATVDQQTIEEVFMFVVVGGGSIGTSQLFENNRITVTISGDLLDVDDNKLEDDFIYYFTTTYSPLYSSVRKLRLDLGPLISQIPDDTINLAIFEASLLADAITFENNTVTNTEYFEFARRHYVSCLAGITLLSNKGTQGKSKRLADLAVELSGDPNDKLKDLQRCLAQYEPIIKSHGELGVGTSVKPAGFVKGSMDPDKPTISRLWTNQINPRTPAANIKVKARNSRRPKKTYINPRWKSRWDED